MPTPAHREAWVIAALEKKCVEDKKYGEEATRNYEEFHLRSLDRYYLAGRNHTDEEIASSLQIPLPPERCGAALADRHPPKAPR